MNKIIKLILAILFFITEFVCLCYVHIGLAFTLTLMTLTTLFLVNAYRNKDVIHVKHVNGIDYKKYVLNNKYFDFFIAFGIITAYSLCATIVLW